MTYSIVEKIKINDLHIHMTSYSKSDFEKIGKKFKSSYDEGIFKNFCYFGKCVALSPGSSFDPETVLGVKFNKLS